MDLQENLPKLMPHAIAWAKDRANEVSLSGIELNEHLRGVAQSVGVIKPELIRLALVDSLPMPQDPMLKEAAIETGLLGPGMVGLTLGYAVFICHGHYTVRLLSHEFRHVYQYEEAGSIAAFLPVYLDQIARFGCENAPYEQDACAHEQINPVRGLLY